MLRRQHFNTLVNGRGNPNRNTFVAKRFACVPSSVKSEHQAYLMWGLRRSDFKCPCGVFKERLEEQVEVEGELLGFYFLL